MREELLLEFARENGIDAVGIAPAAPFAREQAILTDRLAKGELTRFSTGEIERRCDPQRVLTGARSIVTAAVSYLAATGPAELPAGGRTGWIARYARGEDYHTVLREKLNRLAEFLRRETSPAGETVVVVDSGPLVERAVAVRSGIGWYGENCSVFVPGCGSWVSLGEVITTAELPPGSLSWADRGGCAGCGVCRQACPTGALAAPYLTVDRRCLSYITQTKGFIPREYRSAIGSRLWGCDTCQEACPVNQSLPLPAASRCPGGPGAEVELLPLLGLSNREFRAAFGRTAIAWRGRETVQRNALVVLGNAGDPIALPALSAALTDSRPVIRGHAAWALGQVGGRGSRTALAAALAWETDERVGGEIRAALDGAV